MQDSVVSSFERFLPIRLPISRANLHVITEMLINGPAIVGGRRFGPRDDHVIGRVLRRLHVGDRMYTFPTIRRYEDNNVDVRAMVPNPIIRVTQYSTNTIRTVNMCRLQDNR